MKWIKEALKRLKQVVSSQMLTKELLITRIVRMPEGLFSVHARSYKSCMGNWNLRILKEEWLGHTSVLQLATSTRGSSVQATGANMQWLDHL